MEDGQSPTLGSALVLSKGVVEQLGGNSSGPRSRFGHSSVSDFKRPLAQLINPRASRGIGELIETSKLAV